MPQVLVVDDDPDFTAAVAEFIEQHGLTVATVGTLQEARTEIEAAFPDLLLVDLILPDGSGLDLIPDIDADTGIQIVVITGHASIDTAIAALRARVSDFLLKPIDIKQLRRCLQPLIAQSASKTSESADLEAELPAPLAALAGDSPAMRELRSLVEKVAPTDATVLLQGESGTGKELVSRAIHELSPRRDRRFLAINCGAVAPNLIGSELFGHEKGSFTGAVRQHKGYFERASSGTLFLDEITEMPLDLQVQLLRVLETGTLMRLGGDQEIAVDVRLVAATNRDPAQAIAKNKLREDLYFRLSVFPIEVPPLRDREGDIEFLAQHFLAELNERHGATKTLAEAALLRLHRHTWPGNVRELRNTVQRAFILADNLIDADDIRIDAPGAEAGTANPLRLAVGMPIEDAEKRLITATLDHYDGNKQKTAEALGISLKTLYNRLKQYDAA